MYGLKKSILPFVVTILLSIITTYFLIKWFEGYSIDSTVKNPVNKELAVKWFITWFIFFFALITLPFLLISIMKWANLKEKDWWKALLGLRTICSNFCLYGNSSRSYFNHLVFFYLSIDSNCQ